MVSNQLTNYVIAYDDTAALNSSLSSSKFNKAVLDSDGSAFPGVSTDLSNSQKRQKKVVINYADHHRMSIDVKGGHRPELDNLELTP